MAGEGYPISNVPSTALLDLCDVEREKLVQPLDEFLSGYPCRVSQELRCANAQDAAVCSTAMEGDGSFAHLDSPILYVCVCLCGWNCVDNRENALRMDVKKEIRKDAREKQERVWQRWVLVVEKSRRRRVESSKVPRLVRTKNDKL